MKITSEFLRQMHAGKDFVLAFESEWPDGAELMLDNLLWVAKLGWLEWLAAHLLYDRDGCQAHYELAVEPAYEEYDRALSCIEEAYRDYNVYIPAASSIYDFMEGKGMIAQCEAHFMQLDPAHQALKKARAPYRATLYRALAIALIEALEAD